jgi:hypothetical protein
VFAWFNKLACHMAIDGESTMHRATKGGITWEETNAMYLPHEFVLACELDVDDK